MKLWDAIKLRRHLSCRDDVPIGEGIGAGDTAATMARCGNDLG